MSFKSEVFVHESSQKASIDTQLSRWLGAIPILIPILQRLNVVSIINRYCPCQADVDEGTVLVPPSNGRTEALILALNRLMSPRPLYKVADWMAETILNETPGISVEKLHDRRLGDFLDAIYPHSVLPLLGGTRFCSSVARRNEILFFRCSAERELTISGKTLFIKLFRNMPYL
jgi:hypothetical protein